MISKIVDLHIHSKYSSAASPRMTIENISTWAGIKGIDIIATGDALQSDWLLEIKSNINFPPEGLGWLRGKESTLRFVLQTEVSVEFAYNNRGKRIHFLLLFPSLDAVETVRDILLSNNQRLDDGRPSLFVDLDWFIANISPHATIIPAHYLTSYFGLFGYNGGFRNISDLDYYSYEPEMLETGLSSTPEMASHISALDYVSFVSFSDAHSPERLAREATIVTNVNSYNDLIERLKSNPITLEWYPHLGKYHYSGHQRCHIRVKDDTFLCPVCNKPLTMGVQNRVNMLSDREDSTIEQQSYYVTSLSTLMKAIGYRAKYPIEGVKELRCFIEGKERDKLPDILKRAVIRFSNRDIDISAGFDSCFGTFRFKEIKQLEL